MALINCPECGREKVSDTAESCPSCGYAIKAHFEEIKKEEERITRDREEEKARIEAERMKEEHIKSVPKPTKPKISIGWLICSALIMWLAITLLNSDEYDRKRSMNHGNGDPAFYGMVLIITSIVILCYVIWSFARRTEIYKLSQTNFEEYQRQVVNKEERISANAQAQTDARNRELANRPCCPYCNSQNTTKITTTAKAVNTAMFGVLGNKRKHQWKCNDCNSYF